MRNTIPGTYLPILLVAKTGLVFTIVRTMNNATSYKGLMNIISDSCMNQNLLINFHRSNHPFTKLLLKHGTPWRAVASSVNIEFRRITKFSSIIGGTSLYITDSWIVKCSAYQVNIAHQPDVHLSIIHAEDHDISHESNVAVQFLNIRVSSITPGVKPFVIRLNSTDYGDLREKLQAPIRNARNVVIHQSLSDKFLEAFKEQVSHNEVYQLQEGEEVSL